MTRRAALASLLALLGAPAALAAPRRKPKRRKPAEKLVDLSVVDKDVRSVLQWLAREGGYNLFLSQKVKGAVTLHLEGIPVLQAMRAVCGAVGADLVVEQRAVRVRVP